MIVRYWSARFPAANLRLYREHLEGKVFPELNSIAGFLRAELLTRALAQDEIEAVVLTTWRSFASIDAFAGPDRDRAVISPAATALFTSYDPTVRHYELLSSVE